MNYIQEALQKLNNLGKSKKEAWSPNPEIRKDWKELKTFKDVVDFGKGSKWVVAKPDGELYYNSYLKKNPGCVFVGRGSGDGRMLGMKCEDGSIKNVYDVNNVEVKDFDINFDEYK